jgi:hypothetical protein
LKSIELAASYLDSNNFAGVHFDSNEESVVADVVAATQRFVRYKSGKAESERVRLPAWALEVPPCRIRDEALNNIASLEQNNSKVNICFYFVSPKNWSL